MDIVKIDADNRPEIGKGPNRRLRNAGKIPAIAYGPGLPTVHLAVSPKAILTALKGVHGRNTVLELNVDGGRKITALVRDYAYHPVSRELVHVDFVEVKLDKEVDIDVPFATTGKAAGITAGGTLRVVYRTLPLRCVPEKIPAKVEHDITNLGLNEVVKANQIKLPEGVRIRLPDDQTIATIIAPEKDRGDEGAEAAAGAAAPAAAAAAAPKKDEKKDAKKK
ncbi:MAG TPA: 50S ribosomal protein L25 [Polyangiaceae bacterium]|nr:50S ribosomal protein L25 [Polyangiaceae bacterium]